MMTKRAVTIKGLTFESVRAAADHFGVTRATIQRFLKTGRAVFLGNNIPICVPVIVRGIRYESMREAARAVGVSTAAISQYLDVNDHLDGVGFGPQGRPPSPVRIRGVKYKSQAAAAEALSLTPAAISAARRDGRLETVGLQKTRAKKVAK